MLRGALSSSPSLRVLASFLQARQRKHHAPSRLSLLAMLSQCNVDRCSTAQLPLYGPDTLALVSGWVPSPEGGSRARNPLLVTVLDLDIEAPVAPAAAVVIEDGAVREGGEGEGGEAPKEDAATAGPSSSSSSLLTLEDRSPWWRKDLIPGRPYALGR